MTSSGDKLDFGPKKHAKDDDEGSPCTGSPSNEWGEQVSGVERTRSEEFASTGKFEEHRHAPGKVVSSNTKREQGVGGSGSCQTQTPDHVCHNGGENDGSNWHLQTLVDHFDNVCECPTTSQRVIDDLGHWEASVRFQNRLNICAHASNCTDNETPSQDSTGSDRSHDTQRNTNCHPIGQSEKFSTFEKMNSPPLNSFLLILVPIGTAIKNRTIRPVLQTVEVVCNQAILLELMQVQMAWEKIQAANTP
ncbi:hypothetical protein OGAPHI_007466 [Ogataea philodendri]|uniref:Uncharacterized protein n=1 Tax=Ogataea philodendri TaxID=1378263 RepID=A0A9P8T058_9ASCO|nr:uncharacterized protein OGAPHI_007466 [Ogataea philodendri]KAH3660261.1 hypothetical protein OGAPHI_007466 [Ogataea philodendri]